MSESKVAQISASRRWGNCPTSRPIMCNRSLINRPSSLSLCEQTRASLVRVLQILAFAARTWYFPLPLDLFVGVACYGASEQLGARQVVGI